MTGRPVRFGREESIQTNSTAKSSYADHALRRLIALKTKPRFYHYRLAY